MPLKSSGEKTNQETRKETGIHRLSGFQIRDRKIPTMGILTNLL